MDRAIKTYRPYLRTGFQQAMFLAGNDLPWFGAEGPSTSARKLDHDRSLNLRESSMRFRASQYELPTGKCSLNLLQERDPLLSTGMIHVVVG